MNIAIVFHNLGNYHLARIDAMRAHCMQIDARVHPIEIFSQTSDHPWGRESHDLHVHTLFNNSCPRPHEISHALTRVLQQVAPDVVFIPGWGTPYARNLLTWCRAHNVGRVLMSETHYHDTRKTWIRETYKRYAIIRHFDSALVGGRLHRDYLMSLGMSKDRIFLGYDIVNNTFFARQPRVVVDPASTHSHRTPVVLASSRFIARKNLPLLIRAFARAQERVPVKWNLILLGDGPQREALSTLITTLNLTGTVFLPGFMNSAECRRHYHEADVFVHPATTEQWGLVVNEAMAAQLPVIVSRTCGCVPELVEDGTTGFTFSPTDEDTLVAALTKVMSNAPLRATLGRNALQRVSTVCGPDTFGKAAADAALLAVARTHTTR